MTIDRETRTNIKDSIKALVERKVALTRERRAYKLRTRPLLQTGEITEGERRSAFGDFDAMRADLKIEIRHGLLLYGYIRGRDYKQVERRCAEDNMPSSGDVGLFADGHLILTMAQIDRWFEGEPSPHRWKRPDVAVEAA